MNVRWKATLSCSFPINISPAAANACCFIANSTSWNSTRQVEDFKARLIDRFGKIPPETEELTRIVPLRRLAKRMAIEKVSIKSRPDDLVFCSKLESPYYQSKAFGKVIEYMEKYPRNCNLREQNGKRSMVMKEIHNVSLSRQRIAGNGQFKCIKKENLFYIVPAHHKANYIKQIFISYGAFTMRWASRHVLPNRHSPAQMLIAKKSMISR